MDLIGPKVSASATMLAAPHTAGLPGTVASDTANNIPAHSVNIGKARAHIDGVASCERFGWRERRSTIATITCRRMVPAYTRPDSVPTSGLPPIKVRTARVYAADHEFEQSFTPIRRLSPDRWTNSSHLRYRQRAGEFHSSRPTQCLWRGSQMPEDKHDYHGDDESQPVPGRPTHIAGRDRARRTRRRSRTISAPHRSIPGTVATFLRWKFPSTQPMVRADS